MDDSEQLVAPGDLRVIGISTHSTIGPVEPFWLNLEPGMTVLYGRNGTGKTNVLRTIAQPGKSYISTLYFNSLPSSLKEPLHYLFWSQLSIESQSMRSGFHDDMTHFLDETDRSDFSNTVYQLFLQYFLFVLDEANVVSTSQVNELKANEELLENVRAQVDEYKPWKLNQPLRRIFANVEIIAYKNELWIFPEEFQTQAIIQIISLVVQQSYAVTRDQLFLVDRTDDGFFKTLCKRAIAGKSENDYYFIDMVEEYGSGIANLIDDWRDYREESPAPWEDMLLTTGLGDPRWGRIVSDVDLSQQDYGLATDSRFVEEVCASLENERHNLAEGDPRFLSYGDGRYRSLVLEITGATSWDEGAIDLISLIVNRANSYFQLFLESAPMLSCTRNEIVTWADSSPVCWHAVTPQGDLISLTDLSWAEQRWASMAIRLATPSSDLPTKLIVIDEPERGLHRRAERTLANALQQLSITENITCVVATHSPAFLGLNGARLHHLWKSPNGTSVLESLPSDIESWANELGLEKADLLQLCRLFLIVEGEHDALIMNTLFNDEFSQFGVRAIPLRGLRNITNATDASFIFRYTDASILYLTDNDNHQRVTDIWERALIADPDQKFEVIKEFSATRKTPEAEMLKEFASHAIDFSSRRRIKFSSLPADDILKYLPVTCFVPGQTSWEDLHNQWKMSKKGNFKSWLTNTYGATFDNKSILKAVESLDQIPKDLTDILNVIIENASV